MSNREELLALPIVVPPEGLVPLADKKQYVSLRVRLVLSDER